MTARPQRGRRRAEGPAVTDPTVLGDIAATAVAAVAVVWALILGALLPVGTSAVAFAATAGGAWLAWPALAAYGSALLAGAR